jgi:hypothetical protein
MTPDAVYLRMIFSENRFTLFRIMRWAPGATLKQNGRPFWAAVSLIGISRD